MSEIATKVVSIITDKLGVEESQVVPEASFTNDLGADSLDTVELIMELEKEFDLSIPVGLSYEFSDFVIDARYNIGVTNLSKLDLAKPRNSVIMLTVGYKIPF